MVNTAWACMCAKSLHLGLTLCDPMECGPPGSSVSGILQARILEWVAVPSSRGSSWARDPTCISNVSFTGRRIPYHCTTWETNLSKEWAWLPLRPSPCERRWPGIIEHQPQGHLLYLLVVGISHVRSLPGASSPFLLWESFFNVLLMSTSNLPCVSWDPFPLFYRYFHCISLCCH